MFGSHVVGVSPLILYPYNRTPSGRFPVSTIASCSDAVNVCYIQVYPLHVPITRPIEKKNSCHMVVSRFEERWEQGVYRVVDRRGQVVNGTAEQGEAGRVKAPAGITKFRECAARDFLWSSALQAAWTYGEFELLQYIHSQQQTATHWSNHDIEISHLCWSETKDGQSTDPTNG